VINTSNATHATQLSQLSALAGETLDNIELVQHFGLTSNPPPDSDAIVIPLGGKSSHSVIIASENGNYRIKGLPSGATAVYDQSGSKIVLNNDKTIDVFAKKTTYHGDMHCTGSITSGGDMIAGNISQMGHTHGGVMPGPGNTGKPQ